MELLILQDLTGTHADVTDVAAQRTVPVGRYARVLAPGESYRGIPYAAWRAHLGRGVDVLHLQDQARTEVWEDWQEEPDASDTSPQEPLPEHEYGYDAWGHLVGCSREQLVAHCCEAPGTVHVWTPDSPGLVAPEEIPFLVEAYRQKRITSTSRTLAVLGFCFAVWLGLVLWSLPKLDFRPMPMLILAFLAAYLVVAAFERADALRSGPASFQDARLAERHAAWIRKRPVTFTPWILGSIIAVAFFQFFTRKFSIEAAGLVKPAVRAGELWRLFTAPLLHAGFMHFWINFGGLRVLARMVEVHSRRAYLPLVFLLSALLGGVFSLVLLPETTSVGASGGILGLVGFLVVLGRRGAPDLPPGFTRRMGMAIAATAALGIVGFAFIDNAAHLGGLVGGLVLGHFLLRDEERRSKAAERWITLAGYVSLGIVVASVLLVLLTFTHPF